MNRRRFIGAGAASVAWLARPGRSSGQAKVGRLGLAAAQQPLVGADNPRTAVWAYNGSVPGPELRFRQGERLRIEVENALDAETTVHWHGIRLPNAMDGVPHLTQASITARGGRSYTNSICPMPARIGITRISAARSRLDAACTGR